MEHPSNTPKNAPRLIFRWLAKEKEVVSKIYLLAMMQGFIYLSLPLGIQGIVTFTMSGKFSASLVILGAITVIATLYIGLLQLWQMRINETLHEKIFSEVTDRVSRFVTVEHEQKARYFLAHFFEVVGLQKGIAKILLDFSFSAISIVFGLLLLPAYSGWFFIFAVVLAAAFYFIVVYYGRPAVERNIKASSQKYYLFDWFNRVFNTELAAQSQHRSDELLQGYLRHRKAYFLIMEKQYIGILVFKVLFVALVLFLGAFLVQIGELNIGQFVASEIIIILVISSVEKLIASLGTFYDIITALYKLESVFAVMPEQSYLNAAHPPTLKGINHIYKHEYGRKLRIVLYSALGVIALVLLAPWTQNVSMNGRVTVLNPEHKPQSVTSRITGRIEKWHITDGQKVKRNDTIAFISEIKEEYIDPLLVERSESQIKAKESSVKSYENKINSIDYQIDALNKTLRIKSEQLRNKLIQMTAKLQSDSAEAVAAENNYLVAEEQFHRYEELLQKGVISKTDLEGRKVKLQEALAKKISTANRALNSRNELLNISLELNSIQQDFREKLMKAESDKFSTISLLYDAEGAVTKLQNQMTNYSMRRAFYYVLAPQEGYVHNIRVSGVGEIVKEGGELCDIVPANSQPVVELYADPVDLPLITVGSQVQLIFDGWPAFVFSGWPGMSYGSFSAEIVSHDRVISPNGKFRVLAKNTGKPWPDAIQLGGGVKGFALLQNVPLVYELWRRINGFPPEYYQKEGEDKKEGSKDP